jgi:hypothetical protein
MNIGIFIALQQYASSGGAPAESASWWGTSWFPAGNAWFSNGWFR